MAQNTRTGDLTSGPMLQKIILFSLPLAASSILQLLFNAADVVVVGRFAGSTALAAVGSNGALINLLVNLFVGLSLGANVVAARCFGAKDEEGVRNTVQTSVTLGLVSGFLLAVVGFFAARVLLELMSCPEDVIGLSTLYLKIYFIGMPMTMLYNFSSALLRAVGDTKRPLFCLAVAGVINVVLNLVFVILFSMSVAGVALATIISQTVSACMVTALLVKEKGPLHLDLGHLGFHAGALGQILRIGLPAGLQSTVFSLSNVVIQSAVNSFGSIVVAGNSAASNLEGFVYTAMNAFAQAAVTFTSQNMGARRYDNLDRVMRNCLLCATVTGLVLGGGASLLGEPLLHFYSSDEVVTAVGAVSPPGGDLSEPVSQATMRIVKVFWALDSSLAYKRHFPAINWLSSYSLYLDSLKPWFDENLGPEFMRDRTKAMGILQNEASLNEIVQLVGKDALGAGDQLTLEVARMVREDFLQQNAFMDVDSFSDYERQKKLLGMILSYDVLCRDAIAKGASAQELFQIPAREQIGRAKSVPAEEYAAVYDQIQSDMEQQIAAIAAKGGDDE